MNSHHNHRLRLFDSWPAKQFWVKMVIQNEGLVFTEMYLQHRQNGMLNSMQYTGETETLMQFLDRFCGKYLKPTKAVPTSVGSSPLKSPEGRPTPKPGKRGRNRDQPGDGMHQQRVLCDGKKKRTADGNAEYPSRSPGRAWCASSRTGGPRARASDSARQ